MRNRVRGEATVLIIVAVAAVALLGFVVKPSWFPGASKRAAQATKATANLVSAVNEQSAVAAASATQIGVANTLAPDSPSKEFITREVPVLLSRLQPPDPKELIEAEKRRTAVMEGKLDVALKLYGESAKKSERLQAERDEAIAKRQASDLAAEKAAAAEHAARLQSMGLALVALLILGVYIYSRIYSITPATLGKIAADVRSGIPPIQALDANVAPRFFARVQRAAKLATDFK